MNNNYITQDRSSNKKYWIIGGIALVVVLIFGFGAMRFANIKPPEGGVLGSQTSTVETVAPDGTVSQTQQTTSGFAGLFDANGQFDPTPIEEQLSQVPSFFRSQISGRISPQVEDAVANGEITRAQGDEIISYLNSL